MKRTYTTPAGEYPRIYADMLKQAHLLIAGATGSGKSVVINGIIYTALYNSPASCEFILIDTKRVELSAYRGLPHVLRYATEPHDMTDALRYELELIDARYKAMSRARSRKYDGADVYVIIDELADLMTTNKREVMPLLQRLCQIGRAARVHVIAATQCPLSAVIPTPIKVNFDAVLGLRTRCAQDSRNILGERGCECLPRYGKGFYRTPEGTELYNIPMIEDDDLDDMIDYWQRNARPRFRLFA